MTTIPVIELEKLFDESFPENLVLIEYQSTPKMHHCYCTDRVHGVAVFSTEQKAASHLEIFESPLAYKFVTMTFDEARSVAQNKPAPIVALILLDNINDPKIHYVK